MRQVTYTLLIVLGLLAGCSSPDPVVMVPEPGVSQQLAQSRALTITDVSYDLHFRIPESQSQPVSGRVAISLTLLNSDAPLVIDFRAPADHIHQVLLNGQAVEYSALHDHIVIGAGLLSPGPLSVEINFQSTDSALNRQSDFLYTLFVPDNASTAYPLFEQPDIKANYRLSLSIPADWQALANGQLLSRHTDPDRNEADRLEFATTQPLSSYLFAFAAGRFQTETAVRNGRQMTMYHREADADSVARNLNAIFDLHVTALDWLEDYTTIDYPFDKFDFFAIPAFQFGGMEHPGAIWYRAESLFLDPGTSRSRELGRASLIAHETAHMWFGDLVTMRWFNDVWMKEVFANFLAAKIAGPAFPELDLDLRFYQAHHPTAYAVDRTAGANPIRQPLDNLREAGSLYGAIIYQKAPVVMNQLELLLGEQTLRDGLRTYLSEYAFANADWQELIEILDASTELDLLAWSRAWVDQPGRPRVQSIWQQSALEIVQRDDDEQRDQLWAQPLSVLVSQNGQLRTYDVELSDRNVLIDMPDQSRPDFVLAGIDGVSYGRFEMDESSRQSLLTGIHELDSALHRAVAWQHLWEDVLEHRLAPEQMLQALMSGLQIESDALLAQQMMGLVRSLWWRYIPDDLRQRQAAALEQVLWDVMQQTSSSGDKGAYFDTLVNVTVSRNGVRRLYELWSGDGTIEGLPLQEQQFITLAEELALRGRPDVSRILDEQQSRITNPDRLARFQFVRTAFEGNANQRSAMFNSFADVRNRQRESWVLDAARAIHHPLRAQQSLPLIRAGLELVEEIQQTGDIFFPLRWLHAILDGHSSSEAAAVVELFIADNSDMPPKLMGKLLQAADGLQRAAE
jgi:aminopeptidase N